jgi:hypothetical protein
VEEEQFSTGGTAHVDDPCGDPDLPVWDCIKHGAELVKDGFLGVFTWNGWARIGGVVSLSKGSEDGSVELSTAKSELSSANADKVSLWLFNFPRQS